MHLSLFPAFFDRPQHIRFADQEPDEIVELLLRQHWITNLPWIIISLTAIFAPFVILNLVPPSELTFLSRIPSVFITATIVLWYLLITAFIIEQFLHWYFNIYIVTNRHVIDINFNSILSREKLEAGIDNVESASAKIDGIIRSFFNFGKVVVQTAAENQTIIFDDVPLPDKVSDRVNDLRLLAKTDIEQ